MSIKTIYVEKKEQFSFEQKELFMDLKENLNIKNLNKLRVLNRYDVKDLSQTSYERAKYEIFSEPPVDYLYEENIANLDSLDKVFAIEYLPGQYDQRQDWTLKSLKILSSEENPKIRCKKVYVLNNEVDEESIKKIKKYLINEVDSKEASLEKEGFKEESINVSKEEIIDNFINMNTNDFIKFKEDNSLAMTLDDLEFIKSYYIEEKRNPTRTELKVLDTYWSDHCRHTTFNTEIKDVEFEDGEFKEEFEKSYNILKESFEFVYKGKNRPLNLMNIATLSMKELKKLGKLEDLEVSDEINACSIIIDVKVQNGNEEKIEKYLLMFKNETHNHPTEIEPFGGAATCLGGAIRDPLSGRSYVYQAMRITGAADPTKAIESTLKGKLPQKTICKGAARGYSSYGNQIGLSTGFVKELYHEDFVAKRMEVGAVIGANKLENVMRKSPDTGDVILLIGGRTGRDGCGGATGSSVEHDDNSILECGAQVQKGNAVEERKLQRFFRNSNVSKLIKKANDFGAGGVSVAIGEIADSLEIDLDKVPKKYEGLNGTELAISESQERMAVCVKESDVDKFMEFAKEENIECTKVAVVTNSNRLVMKFKGQNIVDLKRSFLDSNGASQSTNIIVKSPKLETKEKIKLNKENIIDAISNINVSSDKGLVEMFDSTIGSNSTLMPFGGKHQLTKTNIMAAKIPVLDAKTSTVSVMSYGYDPYLSKESPYHGSINAVVESVSKLVSAGANYSNIRFSFQEYFEKLSSKEKWGKPFVALLGANRVLKELSLPAIGGKDSMSGTFNDINVPPTLISFAVNTMDEKHLLTNEFKSNDNKVIILEAKKDKFEVFDFDYLKNMYDLFYKLNQENKIISATTLGFKGTFESIFKSLIGNHLGFRFENLEHDYFAKNYGSLIIEVDDKFDLDELKTIEYKVLGTIIEDEKLMIDEDEYKLKELVDVWKSPLDNIYKDKIIKEDNTKENIDIISYKEVNIKKSNIKIAKPNVLVPVFPGTNCEYDIKRVFDEEGAKTKFNIFKNLSESDIQNSIDHLAKEIKKSQIIALPGGFSASDEPDGSGKFISIIFRNDKIKEAIAEFLDKNDGLMIGICNGFQALIKLGLLPDGKITKMNENSPTLTYNEINRHISKIVNTKIISNKSPWLYETNPDDVYKVAVSHGEGRFSANEDVIKKLIANNQIATQYVDLNGKPSMDGEYNPNGSKFAIEGITSPDGKIFGKMGHSERINVTLYKNVVGSYDSKIFKSGVKYFS